MKIMNISSLVIGKKRETRSFLAQRVS